MALDYNGVHDEHLWEASLMIEMESQRVVDHQTNAKILMLRMRFTL
jgi:hypothetical protein